MGIIPHIDKEIYKTILKFAWKYLFENISGEFLVRYILFLYHNLVFKTEKTAGIRCETRYPLFRLKPESPIFYRFIQVS